MKTLIVCVLIQAVAARNATPEELVVLRQSDEDLRKLQDQLQSEFLNYLKEHGADVQARVNKIRADAARVADKLCAQNKIPSGECVIDRQTGAVSRSRRQ